MKIEVKVLKLAGETGLRRPGSFYPEYEVTAAYLEGKGLVEIVSTKPKPKQEKVKLETKQEKFKVPKVTKGRKPKSK
jgi:hypothetical protein